jgi:hypothetical protein
VKSVKKVEISRECKDEANGVDLMKDRQKYYLWNFVLSVFRGISHYSYCEGSVFTMYAIVFDKKISLKEIAEIEDDGESSC